MEIRKYTEWLMDNCEIVYDEETGEAILWRYDCEEYSFNGIIDLYFRLTKQEPKKPWFHTGETLEEPKQTLHNTDHNKFKDFSVAKEEILEEETVEEYFLSCIKNVLQFGNDAQAIRFMEKYYESKKQQDEK